MRLKTPYAARAQSCGFLLWKTANRLQRLHGRALAALDLTPSQCALLACLVGLAPSGAVTSARIAQHTGMDKMLVSDLVKALQRKRLLTRAANPADARSRLLEPTARGVALSRAALARIEALEARFFQPARNLKGLQRDLRALCSTVPA